jgi:hypothetical protein
MQFEFLASKVPLNEPPVSVASIARHIYLFIITSCKKSTKNDRKYKEKHNHAAI